MSTYSTHRGSARRGGYSSFRNGRPQRSFGGGRSRQGRSSQGIDARRYVNKRVVETVQELPYQPKFHFSDFQMDARIKENIARKGYEIPTPIQDQAIPLILEGRDIVGIANTGTGKTGAFLIPLLNKIVLDRNQRVLIMVPTRELAVQIEEEYRGFAAGSGFGSVCAVGGANINPQIRNLRANPYFVIGTPGRLKDLMDRRALDLSKFQTVVLDEADRMLDMGFIHDMRFILSHMPKQRHTLFFSATLSRDIERLIGDFLVNPARVSVKYGETAANVDQDIIRLAGRNRVDVLADLLTSPEYEKVIVFGRTKHGVEKLSKALVERGFRSASIHGNKSQTHRQRALNDFKKNAVRVLCATDVAARGIDVDNISHVINYDEPNTYDDYVHRIGRTGRAGKGGKALTFVD